MKWHFQAGELDKPVTIQKKSVIYDDYNQPVETWVDEHTVFAQKVEQGSKEGLESGQIVAIQDVRFRIYWYEGLNPAEYRIMFDGKIYDIEGVKELGFRDGMELMTTQRDNE